MGEEGVEERQLVGNIKQLQPLKNTYLSHKEMQSFKQKRDASL
jgi:hypothetical protein